VIAPNKQGRRLVRIVEQQTVLHLVASTFTNPAAPAVKREAEEK
jgi:hypothetical protein